MVTFSTVRTVFVLSMLCAGCAGVGDKEETDESTSPEETDADTDSDADADADSDTDADTPQMRDWWPDVDGDGFGDGQSAAVQAVDDPSADLGGRWVDNGDDCDDADRGVHPGADEVCDGFDNDCDGDDDENQVFVDYWPDDDSDGYGDASAPAVTVCSGPPSGHVTNRGDCDDGSSAVNPTEAELTCDGRDNDCDPTTQDAPDRDGDGSSMCFDCDDADPHNAPGADEVCDGVDNDCGATPIDSGCPTGLWIEPTVLLAANGGAGGVPYTQSCSLGGGAVQGIRGHAGNLVDQLSMDCAVLTVETDTTTWPWTYRVVDSAFGAIGPFGGVGGLPFSAPCGAGEIVTGLVGGASTTVNRIGAECSSIELVGGPGSYEVQVTPVWTTAESGGPGGVPFAGVCPAGEVAIAAHGGAGNYVDSVGLYCGEIMILTSP